MRKKSFLKKIEAGIVFGMIVLGIFIIDIDVKANEDSSSSDSSFPTNRIVMHLMFPPPTVIQENGSSFCKVSIADLPTFMDDIVPILPVKTVRVLLPQKHILSSVVATCSDEIIIGDGFIVQLGETPVPTEISFPEEYNQSVVHFDTSVSYPTEICQIVDVSYFRGYSIAILNVFPVHYLATTGQISYYPEITLTISTSPTDSINPLFRGLPIDKKALLQKVDEASMLSTYNLYLPNQAHSSLVDPSETYDYVIITSRELQNFQGVNTFQDFVNYKNMRGTRTTIISVEDILNDPFYRNDTNHLFNDSQARIRSFIKDAYLNWGIEYILLGGDTDTIPVRGMWFTASSYIDLPGASDSYYACLDGTFNSDWNVNWGESYDGWDIPGSVNGLLDIYAEIYIGRACVDNAAEVANFVSKTVKYEQSIDSSLQKVLLAGEDGWGDSSMEKLIDDETSGYTGIPHDYLFSKLYDYNQGWPNDDWPKTELINRLNDETHLLNHAGHSGQFYNMKLNISNVLNLHNEQPFFAYSQGCLAGAFDNPTGDCIAEYFTVKTQNGAFAGIWNSRFGWIGPSGIFQREFYDAIYGESTNDPQLREIGVANQDAKEDALPYTSLGLYLYLGTNLFGDPQVAIKPAVVPTNDVSVEKIYIQGYRTEYIPANIPITIKSIIANIGRSNETAVQVHLLIDGSIVDTIVVDIVRQSRTVVSFNRTFPSGKHNVTVMTEDVPGETISTNNILCYLLIAGPDIAVVNLQIELPLYISCINKITTVVMNKGLSPISDVFLKLVINGEVVQEEYIPALYSGQTMSISFFWEPSEIDWYNVTVVVDPVFDEGFLDNNIYDTLRVHSTWHFVTVAITGSADFRSIQNAIDWSGEDDIINVLPGIYFESILIDKSIMLLGEDRNTTILEGNGSQSVVVITADNVTLSGFTIQRNAGYGIKVSSDNNCIQANTIKGKNSTARLSKGIYLFPLSDNNLISDNIIENVIATGIHISGMKNYISRNTIIDVNNPGPGQQSEPYAAVGIMRMNQNAPADSNMIIGNAIINSWNGIRLNSNYNSICGNTITGNYNGDGIKTTSAYNYIYKNNISEYSNGLLFNPSNNHNNTISENRIENNIAGIKIKCSSSSSYIKNNHFIGNDILYNDEGVNITEKIPHHIYNNVFWCNIFIENSVFNAYDQGSNIWFDVATQVGNYWSDFSLNPGYPLIYIISGGNNSDSCPLVAPFELNDMEPEKPNTPCGFSTVTIGDAFVFTTSTVDPEDHYLWYLFNWGDGSDSGWLGPYASGAIVTASHIWTAHGVFSLRVTAKDSFGVQSDWSDPLTVTVINRSPNTPSIPSGPSPAEKDTKQEYSSSTIDPDGDKLYYWFEWGDGTCSGWTLPSSSGAVVSISRIWRDRGTYPVMVKVKDDYGGETTWSNPFIVTVKCRPEKPQKPVGPTSPQIRELAWYTSITFDMDGDQIRYQWDWGDSQSDWSGFYDSDITVQKSHRWWSQGNRMVKVRAQDTDGFISDWSESLPVAVPHSYPHSCFLAKTKISMADGSFKNIKDIVVGDLVKSFETTSKKSTIARVTKVHSHSPDEMGDFYIIINKKLEVTPTHPLLIGGKWIAAGDVLIGDCLVDSYGNNVVVSSIEQVKTQVPTYSIEVVITDSEGKTMQGTYITHGIIVASQKDIAINRALYFASEESELEMFL